ncbi:MAG: class I SAM-dependent methyltransferase, partial [Bacteroidetes bacterium]|nr:class I SAM-dependent methyltransferase [Bacteroidota bacterium]
RTEGNRTFAARERMLGLHDAFTYLACGTCGTLQLLDPPADLARYYPSGQYYSYTPHAPRTTWRSRLQDVGLRALMDHRLGRSSPLGAALALSTDKLRWVRPGLFARRSAILDVGCGSGALLLLLQRCGFTDLTGADPFIQADITYPGGPHIHRCELKDVDRTFDLILLNHAFEHMPDPLGTLRDIQAHLVPGGQALIRIPVAGSYAWEHYGEHWVQLDAPRHFFLHTERSIRLLAERTGLALEHVTYDSTAFQFIGSEKYLRGLRLDQDDPALTPAIRKKFAAQAKRLNAEGRGDTASFYLRKK